MIDFANPLHAAIVFIFGFSLIMGLLRPGQPHPNEEDPRMWLDE